MNDLTHQEAAILYLVSNEVIGHEGIADAVTLICRRNNLPDEVILRMANNYVSGMNKLVAYMKEGADTRVLLKLIDGGKTGEES